MRLESGSLEKFHQDRANHLWFYKMRKVTRPLDNMEFDLWYGFSPYVAK
jgi:hypothetical protein